MYNNDTICALATAPGGALGIIRVSGPDAFPIVSSLCSVCCDRVEAYSIHYTHIKDCEEIIDEVMVSVFRSPHSYTGENSVEISCHGSRYILNKVLELLVKNGCRMAEPGEFTKRAYLNGKLDLSQAEAVADLIASTNKATHDIAMTQLRGHYSSEFKKLRDQLLKLTSLLELELDFSDHEDLEFADRTELLQLTQSIDERITQLANSFKTGQALKEGIPVAIIGKTNVGKSTLLNRLLKDDRAIVSDVHGTTRDTIEDVMTLHGVQFRFIDTAGIRQTTDEVEQIGIERTYAAIAKARIILWLIDSIPTEAEVKDITTRAQGHALIPVFNKIDKYSTDAVPLKQSYALAARPLDACDQNAPHSSLHPLIKISAKKGLGIEHLETAIYHAADIPTLSDTDIIVTNARHYEALVKSQDSLRRVITALNMNISGDLIAEDLRLVLSDLAEITGEGQITPQETLNNIFSLFCVGK